MKLYLAALFLVAAIAARASADQMTENVQQALKDQGFYYGEITGQKDTDTTAAIRRYQIRNGLQITGDLNPETLKSLGVDASGAHPVAKVSPTPALAAAPETPDLHAEQRENSAPTDPLTGQPFPEPPPDRAVEGQTRRGEQIPVHPDYETVPGRSAENFAGTPYQNSPPQVQRDVILSAQNTLARRGLYHGAFDGNAGPDLEFSLRAYQARAHLPVTGRLDLGTLAALELLPGSNRPTYVPGRRPSREEPVRGEWIPEH